MTKNIIFTSNFVETYGVCHASSYNFIDVSFLVMKWGHSSRIIRKNCSRQQTDIIHMYHRKQMSKWLLRTCFVFALLEHQCLVSASRIINLGNTSRLQEVETNKHVNHSELEENIRVWNVRLWESFLQENISTTNTTKSQVSFDSSASEDRHQTWKIKFLPSVRDVAFQFCKIFFQASRKTMKKMTSSLLFSINFRGKYSRLMEWKKINKLHWNFWFYSWLIALKPCGAWNRSEFWAHK